MISRAVLQDTARLVDHTLRSKMALGAIMKFPSPAMAHGSKVFPVADQEKCVEQRKKAPK